MPHSNAILERLLKLHPKLIDLSLERMWRLLEALGHPERRLPPVIHVAGTNGKGSTIAFMKAMAEAAGLAVHVYTSPHLIRFHERIWLGRRGGKGGYISEPHLAEVLEECEAANRGAPITFFEITTAAALLAFSRRPADLLLLETGLGGRLDATNVVERPAVTVITPVAMDHMDFLGDTLERIAAEKAGILKPGVPAVLAPQTDAVHDVIAERAAEIGAEVFAAQRHWQAFEQHGRLVWEDVGALMDLPLPSLPGRFQIENAGTAIAALRKFADPRIGERAIARGLRQARWPGRLQPVLRGRLRQFIAHDDELWIDGGHNPHAGQALATTLAEFEELEERPLVLIAGLMRRKDALAWLENFRGLAAQVICVPIPGHEEQAWPAEELAAAACRTGLAARAAATLEEALRMASHFRPDAPVRIVIAGSLYLAGHALAMNAGTPGRESL
jgi:dihydrofolate synthase/folylpolyglutamate synthase